mmetsp:Transcript_4438/g.18193  ORF Transcript_4438/g.18193 Transcript_4438/m.18193 type:complete len:243 (-) Transcript_4438:455-1183(-)
MKISQTSTTSSATGAWATSRTTSSFRPCSATARWRTVAPTRSTSRPSCFGTTTRRWSGSSRPSRRSWRRRRWKRRRRSWRRTADFSASAGAGPTTPARIATRTSTSGTGTPRTRRWRRGGRMARGRDCGTWTSSSRRWQWGTTRTRSASSTTTTRGSSATRSWTGSVTSWRSSVGTTCTGRRTRPPRTFSRTGRTTRTTSHDPAGDPTTGMGTGSTDDPSSAPPRRRSFESPRRTSTTRGAR